MADIATAIISGSAAVLSACVALGGVYVGQRLQSLRELRARREQWGREDQHRFADYKRELYADIIASFDEWYRTMTTIEAEYYSYGKLHDNKPYREWLQTMGDNKRQQIYLLMAKLRLVSNSCWQEAELRVNKLDRLTHAAIGGKPFPEDLMYDKVRQDIMRLTDTFRSDLGGK